MEIDENFRIESKEKDNYDNESIMKWFDKEVEDGENAILVYPNLEALRQIYADYVKRQLIEGNEKGGDQQQQQPSTRRIILIGSFYETVNNIKQHLSAFGVENIQKLVDNGSLVLVDAFHSFFPDVNGMKKLVDTLSERARKEDGRDGVTAVVDIGFFFLFGGDSKATELIKYEASLTPKIQDSNVKGISCYHMGNYETLTKRDKDQITQGQRKKLLEVTELQ